MAGSVAPWTAESVANSMGMWAGLSSATSKRSPACSPVALNSCPPGRAPRRGNRARLNEPGIPAGGPLGRPFPVITVSARERLLDRARPAGDRGGGRLPERTGNVVQLAVPAVFRVVSLVSQSAA